jgi:MFS family permease
VIATIQWVVSIYLLIVSGLLLSFGRLGDLRGHKPVFSLVWDIYSKFRFCGFAKLG